MPAVVYWMWVKTIPKVFVAVGMVVAIAVVRLSQMLRWVLTKTLGWIVTKKAVKYKWYSLLKHQ